MDFQPIESHPMDDKECVLAQFVDGQLYVADRGGWMEGESHEEWEEVDDGVRVKIGEWQDEGCWWTNHCLEFDPTHWAPLNETQSR